jgi:hypothetical protein
VEQANEITRESLIKTVQQLAVTDGKPYVLRVDFKRRTGISEQVLELSSAICSLDNDA